MVHDKKNYSWLRQRTVMKNNSNIIFIVLVIFLTLFITSPESFAQSEESKMFEQAHEYFSKGEYEKAISVYDTILEKYPDNIETLKMKGVAQSNLGNHEESLKEFFKVIQYKPDDVIALTGMGVGFGNLGEYQEAGNYFEKALIIKPDSSVIKNYKEFTKKISAKYPYTPTSKPPKNFEPVVIPHWLKIVMQWWTEGKTNDGEFTNMLEFLIKIKGIQIPIVNGKTQLNEIPQNIKDNAKLWVNGTRDDKDFANDLKFMMENQIIKNSIAKESEDAKTQKEFEWFEKYLQNISKNIINEKRYIEYPNPSKDVIKKFLRDFTRWNFEEETSNTSDKFPDPSFEMINDTYLIHYKVFVNQQPSGLPLDHRGTLNKSIAYWESQELSINNKKAKIDFEIVEEKTDANVWVTWVVRDLGEGVLGHAHLGKGIVEVTLGDYSCDGSFQLYDIASVEKIMTHELGHSIGFPHIVEQGNIMFPSISPKYAYCLLG